MASADPTDRINDRAAEWAVEVAHGEMTPGSHADLQAWLAADRRNRGAYVRACAWLRAAEDAVVDTHRAAASQKTDHPLPIPHNDDDDQGDRIERGWRRRGFLRRGGSAVAGAAALAMSAAALTGVGMQIPELFQKAAPSAGEPVQLRDGSVATLGHGADIRILLSDNIRRVTLLRGEAIFQVAKDEKRPFVVRTGDVYAQATGTVYSVSRVGLTGGTVKVQEGSVLVWPRDERDQAVLLHAGGTVTLDPGPLNGSAKPAPVVAQPLPPPELAQISLDDVPVSQAVRRFNRVNARKIVIADPAIEEIRIIGLYRANDPEQFAKAVAAISGGVVEKHDDSIVVKMK